MIVFLRKWRRAGLSAAGALSMLFLTQSAAGSEEKTSYVYDSLGRLIAADARRVSGGGYSIDQSYDRASNRLRHLTNVVVGAHGMAPSTQIVAGQSILSGGGIYRLTLQHDGNLVLYKGPNQPVWATGTLQPNGVFLAMQGDGNLVLYAANGPVWNSETAGHPGAYFGVQDDGNIVVYDPNNRPLWARFGL